VTVTAGISVPPALDPADRDTVLRTGELELLGRMRYSSNATFLARLCCDGLEALAIYKPRKGERPLWDFPTGTLCQREVAAHEVSVLLGWDIVPATVLRDGPFGEGMVQLFVEHDPEDHYLTLRDEHEERFLQFAAFDVVINNADRKSGHCLRGTDGHVWGIDHGLTFHVEHKLRTVIWDYIGEPLAEDTVEQLQGLKARAANPGRDPLAELLATEELDALAARIDRLLRRAVLPEPRTDYPYPWPIV
jgi:uncharacterized repeat protein (TIGR03843 family)